MKRRHAGGAASRSHPARGVQRARAAAQALRRSAFRAHAGRRRRDAFARELAEPVRQALALLESALAHGPGFDPTSSTRARFYMSDLGQIEFLPPLVERVQRDAPGVRLEAVALEVDDIADALAVGALDVAIGFLPGLGAPVRRQALFRDPYLCLMRADHPITALEEALPGSLACARHLSRRPSRDRGGVRSGGLTRRIALRVPHFTVVPMVLERTDLILTLPARVARIRAPRKVESAAAAGHDSTGGSGAALA